MRRVYLKSVVCFVLAGALSGCVTTGSISGNLGDIGKEKIYKAIKNYPELIRINKEKLKAKDTPKVRLELANNYYQIDDFDSALYYIEPLINKGKNSGAFLLKGQILEAQNNLDEALKQAQKSIELNPKQASAYNLAGVIHAKKGEYSVARENFLSAKSLFLDDEIVNSNLAMLAILMHDYKEAVEYLLPLYNRGVKDRKVVANLIYALTKSGDKDLVKQIIQDENVSNTPVVFLRDLRSSKINLNSFNAR